jgi:hypothetical protein
MKDTTKYRIDGGVMLLKNNNGAMGFIGFFNDEPQAHARVKELSDGKTAIAQDYFLVISERLLPIEVSDEPL